MLIRGYHRPSTLDDALALLHRSDVVTAPIGGGTVLNAARPGLDEVVDLQGLDLAGITAAGGRLTLGAMTRLQELADDQRTPAYLVDLTRMEAPRTIRNAATVGGTVAGGSWESVLLAGLLAAHATVAYVNGDGAHDIALSALLADRSLLAGGIITSVSIEAAGAGAHAGTARTPADTPIVLVAGRRHDEGAITLAATGVAPAPVVIDTERLDALEPPGDFRGTAEYRKHLVAVLAGRVVAGLSGGAA